MAPEMNGRIAKSAVAISGGFSTEALATPAKGGAAAAEPAKTAKIAATKYFPPLTGSPLPTCVAGIEPRSPGDAYRAAATNRALSFSPADWRSTCFAGKFRKSQAAEAIAEPRAVAGVEAANSEGTRAMDIPWQHDASMTRSAPGGDELIGRGILHQLVGAFIEMSPEQQRGIAIRVAGPDWTREYIDQEIRELAARPEYSGAFGHWDSAADPDEPDHAEEADGLLVEGGVSGSSRI